MHESCKSARTLFVAARRGLPRQSSVEQCVSRRYTRVRPEKDAMCHQPKRMRMSSQDSTSCGMQKLLDCSLSTPTLLHHDTAVGDDVRMSAGLPATPDKDAVKQCASRRYTIRQSHTVNTSRNGYMDISMAFY